jgi:hypothetical protein
LRWWVSFFVFLFVACLLFSVPGGLAAGPEEASVAVADAQSSLQCSFRAVFDAEALGANVSGLMSRLNDAGGAFASAGVALSAGNYGEAVDRAAACKSLADGVSGDAGVLGADASVKAAGWWMTVSFSVVGAAVFVAVLFFVWRRFRRAYEEKLLESRPEVAA